MRYNRHAPLLGLAPRGQHRPRRFGVISHFGVLENNLLKLSTREALEMLSDKRLAKADERVFAAIASCRSNRPSRIRISNISGVSLPNISRSLNRLVEFGYLRVERQAGNTSIYFKGMSLRSIESDTTTRIKKAGRSRGIKSDTQALRALAGVEKEPKRVLLTVVK